MQRLVQWFRELLSVRDYTASVIRKVRGDIDKLDQKITKLDIDVKRSENQIALRLRALDQAARAYDLELGRTKAALAESASLNVKLNEALDTTRERLRSAEDITIPGLVAAHQLLIKRAEADTAIQTARAVLSMPQSREVE